MFSKDTVDYATQISVGTTMPYARWKDLKQMPIIIPTLSIADAFQK
jgi:type I restriction enzyme S subunit